MTIGMCILLHFTTFTYAQSNRKAIYTTTFTHDSRHVYDDFHIDDWVEPNRVFIVYLSKRRDNIIALYWRRRLAVKCVNILQTNLDAQKVAMSVCVCVSVYVCVFIVKIQSWAWAWDCTFCTLYIKQTRERRSYRPDKRHETRLNNYSLG